MRQLQHFGIYFFISLAALIIDMLTFAALNYETVLRAGAAAAIGWLVGLIAHYVMAQNLLYKGIRTHGPVIARLKSFLSYAAPSIAGLALTVIVVEIGVALGIAAILAKAAAAIMSFVLAYALRNLMFNQPAAARPA